jgi:MSHA biogenesis protein MshG
MAAFQYRARGPRGDAIEGVVEAASSDLVATRLIEGGLTPVDIRPVQRAPGMHADLADLFPPRVQLVDLIQFSRQMHSLLKAGVPILSALTGLARHARNRTLERTLNGVIKHLEAGRDLSSALSQYLDVFSVFYVSLVRVGETSGQLDTVFRQLAAYLEREKKTRDQIRSALRYPTIVILAVVVAIVIINVQVVPEFARIFAQFHADLPLPTRILVATSNLMINHWPLLAGLALALFMAIRLYIRGDSGRYQWHKMLLRVPLVGKVIYQATLARFARLFALVQSSGIPIVTGLSVVARALDNDFIQERVLSMRDGIERGESLSRTANNCGIFDHLVLQMLHVGEESGATDELLREVADYYDTEVDYSIEKLSSSVGPLLTLALAGLVFLLAAGIFLPMWDLAGVALH